MKGAPLSLCPDLGDAFKETYLKRLDGSAAETLEQFPALHLVLQLPLQLLELCAVNSLL